MELPRNTALQVQEGSPVSREDLAPGDLVFFRRGGTRHVGIYLGDDEFIHASTSRGVTISNLDEDYYRRYYWTARRLLDGTPRYASGEVRRRPEDRTDAAARRRASADSSATPRPAAPDLTPVEEALRRGW